VIRFATEHYRIVLGAFAILVVWATFELRGLYRQLSYEHDPADGPLITDIVREQLEAGRAPPTEINDTRGASGSSAHPTCPMEQVLDADPYLCSHIYIGIYPEDQALADRILENLRSDICDPTRVHRFERIGRCIDGVYVERIAIFLVVYAREQADPSPSNWVTISEAQFDLKGTIE